MTRITISASGTITEPLASLFSNDLNLAILQLLAGYGIEEREITFQQQTTSSTQDNKQP